MSKYVLHVSARIMHDTKCRTARESGRIDYHHNVPQFNNLCTLWQAAILKTLLPNGRSQHRTEGQKGYILKPYSNYILTSHHINQTLRKVNSTCDRPPVLRPAIVLRRVTSTQVILGFPLSISKCWDGSQDSKLPLHAPHVALPTKISISYFVRM
jgi:hypothetical protein